MPSLRRSKATSPPLSIVIRSAVIDREQDRKCFFGILVRLVTGCSWDVAGRITGTSESTLRRRRDEWVAAGVFESLVEEAIAR